MAKILLRKCPVGFDKKAEIEAQIGNVRERMARIDRLRRQDRKQIVAKIFIEPTLVLDPERLIAFDRDARGCERQAARFVADGSLAALASV